ncbi:hypothetical protein Glove_658g9 [Diversispora epigaea]|uniref:Protein kinase domain-containing protein n=1 Tax=Diversispora epigaea TaxID=1348612 RepID=A0A397G7A4_9GLOM|nr:hypothetical protein Glove_658g9 [Diversispora epigaea]
MDTQEIEWNKSLNNFWKKMAYSLDRDIYKIGAEQRKYFENYIKNNSSLTENEKDFLLNELQKIYDINKFDNNSDEKQQCNNCPNWHQATQHCEFFIRKYLEDNFGNWTSGNNEIDKVIQECQQRTVRPDSVIEWISYDRFENVEKLTKGGCATIYTAGWNDGHYKKWNSERQRLERSGRQMIVLKRLNNSNSNNVRWFQEMTLSFTLDNNSGFLAAFYGLTKDPTTQDYMLVLNCYDFDLRHFLKENYLSLTLLEIYHIINRIADSLNQIHVQNIIHRDLHPGNILYIVQSDNWFISDLGLSGPVDKQLDGIYGNLPYIAPELLYKKNYTKKSDVYSLGIIMWEMITGETPFGRLDSKDIILSIINGCRPKIYEYIPYEYTTLMKQCWDANPDNRPEAGTISNKMESLIKLLYNGTNKQQTIPFTSSKSKISQSSLSQKIQTSKVYTFSTSIQPRNATEEEQLAFETKQFVIPEGNILYLAFETKQFVIPKEFFNLSLNDVDNLNASQVDQEYGVAGSSNSGLRFHD